MKILRYTKAIQDTIGLEVDAKDYMHIAIMTKEELNDKYDVAVVYIWDTREMLDFITSYRCHNLIDITGEEAIDNFESLQSARLETVIAHTKDCPVTIEQYNNMNSHADCDAFWDAYRTVKMIRMPETIGASLFAKLKACTKRSYGKRYGIRTQSACDLQQTVRIWSHHGDFGYYKLQDVYNWLTKRYNSVHDWYYTDEDAVSESFLNNSGNLITCVMRSKTGHKFHISDNFVTFKRSTGSCYAIVFATVLEAVKFYTEVTGYKPHWSRMTKTILAEGKLCGSRLTFNEDVTLHYDWHYGDANHAVRFIDNNGAFVLNVDLVYKAGTEFKITDSFALYSNQYDVTTLIGPVRRLPLRIMEFYGSYKPAVGDTVPIDIVDSYYALSEWAMQHSARLYSYVQSASLSKLQKAYNIIDNGMFEGIDFDEYKVAEHDKVLSA